MPNGGQHERGYNTRNNISLENLDTIQEKIYRISKFLNTIFFKKYQPWKFRYNEKIVVSCTFGLIQGSSDTVINIKRRPQGPIIPGIWKFGFGEMTAIKPGTSKLWMFGPTGILAVISPKYSLLLVVQKFVLFFKLWNGHFTRKKGLLIFAKWPL